MKKAKATAFYVVRHGQTFANANKIINGQSVPDSLNQTGKQQALLAAQYFDSIPVAAIYASPLDRTRETAAIIQQHIHGPAVIDDQRLAEIAMGSLEGKSWAHFDSEFKKHIDAGNDRFDLTPFRGESQTQFRGRLYDFFFKTHEKYPGQHVIAVTHGCIIQLLVTDFTKLVRDFRCVDTDHVHANCDIFKWEFGAEEEKISRFYQAGDKD